MRVALIDGTATILVLLLLGSPAAAGQPQKNSNLKSIELCNGAGVPPQARIAGCTALISSGEGNADALAVAYNNRGNAYVVTAEYDRAIKDFDQAIELASGYVKPVNNRGVAYLKKGAYDVAVKAFDEAIKLNPNYGGAFVNRAEAYLKMNEYERAARDFY